MKKTTKMAICAALVVGANLFAPSMPASDNVAMSIVAPANVAYAAQYTYADSTDKSFYEGLQELANDNNEYDIAEHAGYVIHKFEQYEDGDINFAEFNNNLRDKVEALNDALKQNSNTVFNPYRDAIDKAYTIMYEYRGTYAAIAAITAQKTADTANTTANTANTKATQAQNTANTANTTANTANTNANQALDAIYGTDADNNGTRDGGGLNDKVTDLQTAVGNKANSNDVYSKDDANSTFATKSALNTLTQTVNTLQNSGGGVSQSALDAEASARAAKDAEHDTKLADHETRITSNTSRIGTLESVTATHTAQIANHEGRIDDLEDIAVDHEKRITANTKAIAQEVKERKAEVKRLDGRIDQETAERKAADRILAQAIDNEAATRAAVDKFLAESIDAEAETRAKADAQLQRNIEAEAYYRQQGDAQLNHRIDELSDRLNKTTAMTVAIAGLRLPEFNPNKKCTFAIGTGHYRSASAIAACMAYRPTSDISFSINFANSGSENTFSTSFAINF